MGSFGSTEGRPHDFVGTTPGHGGTRCLETNRKCNVDKQPCYRASSNKPTHPPLLLSELLVHFPRPSSLWAEQPPLPGFCKEGAADSFCPSARGSALSGGKRGRGWCLSVPVVPVAQSKDVAPLWGHQSYRRSLGVRESPCLNRDVGTSYRVECKICTLQNITKYFMKSPGCGSCFL